eukprot:1639605-Rhodomonas_salina.1
MGITLDQFHADTQHVYTWPEISVKQAETGLTLEMYDRSPKQLKSAEKKVVDFLTQKGKTWRNGTWEKEIAVKPSG